MHVSCMSQSQYCTASEMVLEAVYSYRSCWKQSQLQKKSCEANKPISRAPALNAVSQSVMRVGKQGYFNP